MAARDSLIGFTCYTKPDYQIADVHRTIAGALEQVERGEIKRLIIQTPPRHGKSELVSRRWPARYLGKFPNRQFISASYGQDLAGDFGRDVRNIIASEEYRRVYPDVSLAPDSSAKEKWHTSRGGVYISAGVGKGITGRGADVLSIDDPVRDRADAESETVREGVWNWYTSTAYTRLMPGGAVVLTMTRWHDDDLAGRLLDAAKAGADQWHVINLPALNEDGSALWPERYDVARLAEIEAAIGPRDWASLYMQTPRTGSGTLFKTTQISVIEAAPAGKQIVRAWDLAATAATGTRNPDWTVGVKLLRTDDGRYVVLDVARFRGGPDEVEQTIVNTAQQDGRSVRVSLPQDPGQAGKQQVLYLTRKLSGFQVESSPETGDKATRAAPVASQVNVGNVSVVHAAWNRPFLDELAGFPGAAKDDQVDALSRAFSMVGMSRGPMRISAEELRKI